MFAERIIKPGKYWKDVKKKRFVLVVCLSSPLAHRDHAAWMALRLKGLDDAVPLCNVVVHSPGDIELTFPHNPEMCDNLTAKFVRLDLQRTFVRSRTGGRRLNPFLCDTRNHNTKYTGRSFVCAHWRVIVSSFDTCFDDLHATPEHDGLRVCTLESNEEGAWVTDPVVGATVWDLVRQCERLKDGGQDPDRLVRRLEAIWEYLAQLNDYLSMERFLGKDNPSDNDLILFALLVRFDEIYASVQHLFDSGCFSVNEVPLDVKLQDFDGLKNFVRAVYQYEGARETMDWDRVKPYQVVSCEDEMVDKHEVQEAWSFDEPDERDFYRPRHESSSSSSRADLLRRIAARVEEDRDEDSCTRLTDTTDVEMDRVERVEPQLEAPPPSPQAAPTAPRNIAPTSSPMDGKWNWLFANKFGS